MSKSLNFIGDNAIKKVENDLFNFEHYALKVQKLIQFNSNNKSPLAFGIYGKWGEGKTSFLNLIENKIDLWKRENKSDKGILKYHFNPWRYSSENEMLFDFFDGLAKTMFIAQDSDLKKVGKGILRFSKYLKAVKISASMGVSSLNKVTATFEPSEILKAMGEDFVGKDITLDKLKDEINNALKVANYKIVVFIDDIDRLDKDEIYTILKLIKLNGNFDNFVYLITLDFKQVSKAISKRYGNKYKDGQKFIEKIINIPVHLPKAEEADLKNFFDLKLEEVSKGLDFVNQIKSDNELQEIRQSYSYQYFKTPREVIRVFNSFFIGAFAIGNEVNLHDLFWIEYLKIKYPKVYRIIKGHSENTQLFANIESTIDFNDEFSEDKKPNGTRRRLVSISKAFTVVDNLFPVKSNSGTVFARPFDDKLMMEELRINTVNNFDKYFSYHTVRKISNVNIYQIKEAIKKNNSKDLKENLKNITDQAGSDKHKVFFIIEELTRKTSLDDGLYFWNEFLFSNLELIPKSGKDMFGSDYKSRIIELISEGLNYDNADSKYILTLASSLDTDELCNFTKKIEEDKIFKSDLEKLVLTKLKETEYITKPFYLDSRKSSNRYIMHYWKKHNPEGYRDFLEKSIDSNERLGKLIRIFVSFWNETFYGNMTKDGYNALKKLCYEDLIFSKIKYLNKGLVDDVDKDNLSVSERDKSTIEDNMRQFVYFYVNYSDTI